MAIAEYLAKVEIEEKLKSCIESVNLSVTEQLLNHIQRHNLCKTKDKILLAVSGGVDSMVMLELFRQAGFNIGVAHCNFQLRGEDSKADEALVNSTCVENKITFHSTQFDTLKYAEENGLSLQMAARELRYQFFDELVKHHQYHYIATAHHLNDSLETVLLNLVRGTGMEGMAGIPVKNKNIIRPLLFATKSSLVEYATSHRLAWREDISNASDDYQRNFMRLQVIPKLKEINPNLEGTFLNTLERLRGSEQLLRSFIGEFRNSAMKFTDAGFNIDKEKIEQTSAPAVLLWELIKEKGFNFDQCQDIVNHHQTGKKFISATHVLVIDRDFYCITEADSQKSISLSIDENMISVRSALGTLHVKQLESKNLQLERKSEIAQLDFNRIKFPLVWRTWTNGDNFIPLGMNHTKKVSDFLIDNKVSLSEKDKVTVLESAGKIIWVVGLRIHDHFKITPETTRVLTLSFEKVGA